MKRRNFLSWLGFGWLMSRLPIAVTGFLAACTGQSQADQAQKTADGFQKVGTIADLDQKKQILVEQTPNPILVVRDPTCTHQGCLVNWTEERKAFTCPCHNSVFAADGKVLQAPATKPLATYPVQLDGQTIMVKVG